MPDYTGKLTEAEKTLALAWLNRHAKPGFGCPVCGSTQWFVADHVTQAVRFGAMPFGGGTSTYPMVLFVSNPCGFFLPFSSSVMGIPLPAALPDPSTAGIAGALGIAGFSPLGAPPDPLHPYGKGRGDG
jgi:hypothetical protein